MKISLLAALGRSSLTVLMFTAAALVSGMSAAQTPSTAQPAVAAVPQEVRVGDLGFRIVSLRASDRTRNKGDSDASIALRIRNYSDKPIALNYLAQTAHLADDHGYVWPGPAGHSDAIGIPTADNRGASVDTVIDSGSELGITFDLARQMEQGQTAGQSFDFQASFASYEDQGQGRLKRLRQYPISIVGIQRNVAAPFAMPGVKEAGDGLKKALGGLFGN